MNDDDEDGDDGKFVKLWPNLRAEPAIVGLPAFQLSSQPAVESALSALTWPQSN